MDSLVSGLTSSSIDLYFSIGIPNGYTELSDGITFEPKLLSLSTNTGSQAGSIITAVVKGVGVGDKVSLYDSVNSLDICQSATVIEYGVLECLTIAQEIAVAADLSIKEIDSGTVHSCAATAVENCQFSTFVSAVDQMAIESASVTSATDISFTGQLFPTSGFTCEAVFRGAVSDSCVIQS